MANSVDMYNAKHRAIIQKLLNNEVSEREYELFMRKMKTTRMSMTATIQKLTGVIPTENLHKCANLYMTNTLLQRMVVPDIEFIEFYDAHLLLYDDTYVSYDDTNE